MCFKTKKGKVKRLKKKDKLIIYCVKNAIKEIPRGGFIGIQIVLSSVYKDMNLFEKMWNYIGDKSKKLKNALNANLEAIGGL